MIELKNIHKSFRTKQGNLDVLRGVSMEIPEDSFCLLYGASGSGKSTLLNLLGLLDTPTSGDYFWNGENMAGLSERQRTAIRRDRIGFVFQSFRLIPVMTAFENVELPLGFMGIEKTLRRTLTEEALERVGLKERMAHLPDNLSGGEQQRIAIARAIVTKPRIVLADEPTGNLDKDTAEEIMNLLEGLDAAVFMVTHDESLSRYADRVYTLKNGVIL